MLNRNVLVGLALVFAIAGCKGGGGGFSQQARAGKTDVFRYPIVTSPTSLDPHTVEDGDTIDLLQQVYEGLVRWDSENRVVPALAESWQISTDGKVYTFKIRSGAKFHNGREVTAEDFKWSLERACTPRLASPVAETYLGDIVGVKDKIAGKAAEISGVKVTGPLELQLTIDKPRPYFLGKITYLVCAALPKESVPADSPIQSADKMVGTGPFKMVSYELDQLAKLEGFKDYWGGAPALKFMERPVVKDAITRLNKFKTGEVDLVPVERQDVAELKKDPNLAGQLKFFDRPAIWYLGLSPETYAPFKDVRVRRAVAMAIDRKQIVDEILGGVNAIAEGILPPGVAGHRPDTKALPFNVAEAKKLLAEAGYPDGKGLPPLEFNFRDSRPDIKLVSENIAGQLKKNLGMVCDLRSMEWGAYLDKRNKHELVIFHMRWAADYLDPENFLSLMLSTTGAENKIGYSNKEFDRLCAQADTMPDGPERLAIYAKAEDLVIQDAPWVPIYFQRDAELISPRVKGLKESLFGHLPHHTVSLSD